MAHSRHSRRHSVGIQTPTNTRRVAVPLSSIRRFERPVDYFQQLEIDRLNRRLAISGLRPLAEDEAASLISARPHRRAVFSTYVNRSVPAKHIRAPLASRAALFTRIMNDVREQPTPWHVLVCVKRRIRREVWFAKQLFRKRGSGAGGPRIFKLESFVRCRR